MKRNITILLALLMTSAVMAQDATPAPTDVPVATVEAGETAEPTAAATAEVVTATPQATPIIILITPPPPVDPPPAPDPTNSNGSSVIVIVISLLTLVLGGGTLMSIVAGFRKDAAGVAATEALGKSVPQEFAMAALNVARGLSEGAAIAIEMFDGIPAASKPKVIAQFTIDELRAEIARQEAAG